MKDETEKTGRLPSVSSFRLHPSSFLRPPRSRGFSLIELMIAVVILGLLSGAAVYAYAKYLDRAKQQVARSDIAHFVGALDAYYGTHGRYPDNQEGLKVLAPDYLKAVPADPWKRPYQYLQPGRSGPYDVICYGADGREGGTGADADVTNADLGDTGKKK